MSNFGDTDRHLQTGGQPVYDPRYFVTNDARCYAIDDYRQILQFLSGPAGNMPISNIMVIEPPNAYEFVVPISGLGGNVSPASNFTMYPLVDQQQFAQVFIGEIYGDTPSG